MIKAVNTTTAKESDIKQLDNLTENETSYIFADGGYMSKAKKQRETRFAGLEKNDQYHLLFATAYNIRRATTMQRKLENG